MMANQSNMVEMRDVTLSFADKVILDQLNLTVPSKETLVVMGLSGSGKSTLLGILMGLLKPDGGSVKFKADDLTKLSRAELNNIRPHLGMVYQNAALISSMTVADNVRLPLQELSNKSPGEIESAVEQKLELVGLADEKNKLPSELSGGMQKRVGLARALALDPELVLFDEPSAGLDPINNKLINDLIVQLRNEQGVTSIVVTHEMESAFAVATRMAFLHEGKILLEGEPSEFRESQDPVISNFLKSYSEHEKEEK